MGLLMVSLLLEWGMGELVAAVSMMTVSVGLGLVKIDINIVLELVQGKPVLVWLLDCVYELKLRRKYE